MLGVVVFLVGSSARELDLTPAHTCPLRKSEPLSVSIPSLRKGRAWAISSSACTTAACPRPSTARDSVQPPVNIGDIQRRPKMLRVDSKPPLPSSCPISIFYLIDSSGHSRFVLRISISPRLMPSPFIHHPSPAGWTTSHAPTATGPSALHPLAFSLHFPPPHFSISLIPADIPGSFCEF